MYNQSGKCKHVGALISYVNNTISLSKTSNEQEWGKPSIRQFVKNKYCKGRYFEDMFPPVAKKKCNLVDPVTHYELSQESSLKQILQAGEQSQHVSDVKGAIANLLNEVESLLEQEDCVVCLNTFFIFKTEFELYHNDYSLVDNLKLYYENHVVVSNEDIIKMSCNTIKQSACPEWYAIRHVRVSASKNVHSIITRTTKSIESLVSDILNPKKVDCGATRYGICNEEKAIKAYEKLNFCQVKRVGVIICKDQNWLCASVDGVVVEDGCISKIIEVKCPISCKKQCVVDFHNNKCNVGYLKLINNKLELKKSHQYYTQVQIQMYATGMSMCDLFIYSPVIAGSVTVPVHRNDHFIKGIILKCELFYFKHYLLALYTEFISNNNNNDCKDLQKRSFTGKNIINSY